eukprot:355061-Chlamydomonas_euryale.AAC.12
MRSRRQPHTSRTCTDTSATTRWVSRPQLPGGSPGRNYQVGPQAAAPGRLPGCCCGGGGGCGGCGGGRWADCARVCKSMWVVAGLYSDCRPATTRP